MPYGQNKAICSVCGQAYITGDCIDLMGKCDECKGLTPVTDAAYFRAAKAISTARRESLKKKINRILLDALSGTDKDLRLVQDNGSYIRWGLVEKRINEAIDEVLGGKDDQDIS